MLPIVVTDIERPDLFLLFKNQLKKDFENCGADVDFIEEIKPDYELILSVISQELSAIIKGSSAKLNQLLYRIDINENQINKLSKAKPDVSFDKILAELIIKRILQKVVIKEVHRNSITKIND